MVHVVTIIIAAAGLVAIFSIVWSIFLLAYKLRANSLLASKVSRLDLANGNPYGVSIPRFENSELQSFHIKDSHILPTQHKISKDFPKPSYFEDPEYHVFDERFKSTASESWDSIFGRTLWKSLAKIPYSQNTGVLTPEEEIERLVILLSYLIIFPESPSAFNRIVSQIQSYSATMKHNNLDSKWNHIDSVTNAYIPKITHNSYISKLDQEAINNIFKNYLKSDPQIMAFYSYALYQLSGRTSGNPVIINPKK